jgi:pimeloyl-ACP methyl ester carboxylesterase
VTRHLAGLAAATGFAVLGVLPIPGVEITAQSAFAPVPCAAREWTAPEVAFSAQSGTRVFAGKYDGGLFRIEIPDKWNGELVLWAHGYVAAAGNDGLRLRVSDHPLRNHLIEQGFAWASSSYRCNGYVPGQALVDTMALVDLFTKTNGGRPPSRTYFTGVSMGGFAALLAMHEMPASLAGALPMCPAGPDLGEFFNDSARTAAKLAGIAPTADSLQGDMKTLVSALGAAPDYTPIGREAANRQITFSGGPRPFAADGALERGQFVSNINTGARALLPAPQQASTYREETPFTGRLTKPTLTMHTTGDLFVPIFLERLLKKAVTSAGRNQFLVQRIYRAAGHCTFSAAETTTAFDDLVTWVRSGAAPAGDDVMADLSDAGRQFTNPLRPGDPGALVVK